MAGGGGERRRQLQRLLGVANCNNRAPGRFRHFAALLAGGTSLAALPKSPAVPSGLCRVPLFINSSSRFYRTLAVVGVRRTAS